MPPPLLLLLVVAQPLDCCHDEQEVQCLHCQGVVGQHPTRATCMKTISNHCQV
jgi:hypothetical protein